MKKLDVLRYHPPSPLQVVEHEAFSQRGLRLFVKRDDLLHPHVSGNKWRKLKHNLIAARRLGFSKLITFGGAFSNHIAAAAAAGMEFGYSTIGVVSGEESGVVNPTLSFAQGCGMELLFTSRANLRNKTETELLELLKIDATGAFILPQGGANCLALPGCREIVTETTAQLGRPPDFFVTACGTGATLAGIATGIADSKCRALGISVLKGGFLQNEVENLLAKCGEQSCNRWEVLNDFHFGGYAKWTPELIEFINDFKLKTGIPLDPIYTGKAFFATVQLAEQGFFPAGTSIVLVHTGGLQGIAGFNERFGDLVL
ncbi:MAG: pyridoxal-phosphate dependent enzyme [Saprospiraceae bacterium]|nr:pyridoxal-phosphate dependent enzyme [Saprospiraceae bacterium]MCF8249809.1 pyridoxal-phosphate dependent enzyme [Saprospiraceae bacterium]MCF8279294.1 pyridoxal-phosphate dependent enzyme [Bacteroidales bacterium]MCF8313440.1 pyridoxal-phosphate dependent enzyme [Saprospiraceae bacterium]MCF8442153.1 pyridoxal-phosphate dependent enzyme [Saprospiraceae bacterium]